MWDRAKRATVSGMNRTLPALGAALCALAVAAAPAGAAKKPKYYFSITTTETYVTVLDCKAIPSGRTKETTHTTRFISQTGHLGGGLKTEGWEQTDLKRETIDNEALPPYELKGEKKTFGSKGEASDEFRLRGGRWTHTYFGPDNKNHRVLLRLPSRVNRETSKTSTAVQKESFPEDAQTHCAESHDYSTTVTVIIQRIQ
jgi:hypothetical protein